MRMAAPARIACWRITLQANASSSGCGAISINLERLSNVEAVKVGRDTLVSRRESKTAQSDSAVRRGIRLDRSEVAIDGLRPKDNEVVPGLKTLARADLLRLREGGQCDLLFLEETPCFRRRQGVQFLGPPIAPMTVLPAGLL